MVPPSFLLPLFAATALVTSFPQYQSLAGIEEKDFNRVLPHLQARLPPDPPAPLSFLGTKLVNDPAHAYIAPKATDMRGPCPGLNTLANHGYLPRDGILSPSQMVQGVQEGYNMENSLARFSSYFAHIGIGNLVTDRMSLGSFSPKTGPRPPAPAHAGGLSTHGPFEGDASLTRADAYWGDHTSFNQSQFNMMKEYSQRYGNGFFNFSVAAELLRRRVQDGIATNPNFSFMGFRHLAAYAEVTFPAIFWVDGRKTGDEKFQLDMPTAERFLKGMQMPVGFHRSAGPTAAFGNATNVFKAFSIPPGRNNGTVNSWVEDQSFAGFEDFCGFYKSYMINEVKGLYPNPKGVLRRNLIKNLQILYDSTIRRAGCPQILLYEES